MNPMHQFEIVKLHPLAAGGYDISFTNSALWMAIALGIIGVFMFVGTAKPQLVPGRWQAAVRITSWVSESLVMVLPSGGGRGRSASLYHPKPRRAGPGRSLPQRRRGTVGKRFGYSANSPSLKALSVMRFSSSA